MAPKLPYMPLYCNDFMYDPKVRVMSRVGRSIYVEMLCLEWLHGPLPDDVVTIARMLGDNPKTIRAHWHEVRPCFDVVTPEKLANNSGIIPSKLSNNRLVIEKLKHNNRRVISAKAAKSRWSTDADAMPSESESYSESSSESDIKKKKGISEATKKKKSPLLSNASSEQVLEALNAARKRAMPNCRGITCTPESLKHISERLDAGATVEDCLHVIAVLEAEVRKKPEASRWFNHETPFRPDNFARNLSFPVTSASSKPISRLPEFPAPRVVSDEERALIDRDRAK